MIRDSQRINLNVLTNETKANVDWLEALGFPAKNKFIWWGPITTTDDLVIKNFNIGGSGTYRTKCPPGTVDNSVLTFPLINSFVVRLKITRDGGQSSLSFSFQFRTFNRGGTLYYQTIDSGLNYVYVGMDVLTGCLEIDIVMPDLYQINYKVYNRDIEANNGTFADGLWHSLSFLMDTMGLSLTVDGKTQKTDQVFPNNLGFDKTSYIGGGRPQYYSFQGCMKQIIIDGSEVDWIKLDPDSRGNGIVNGSCLITDYCSPNPCKHEAPCSQNGDTFFCDCSNTGYAGAVCHQSELYSSCSELGLFVSLLYQKKHNISIDLDGSGVLEPIDVECDFNDPQKIITRVFHDSMKDTRVDGYSEPGSYKRQINYMGSSRESLGELARRSFRCEQAINYRCQNARLLSLPAGGGTSYSNRAWGWWVGRKGQPRFYWGGGVPGLQRCACGVAQECSQNSLTCNCDYITPYPRGATQGDLGLLDFKEDLPVMEVRFGDTGTLADDKYADFNVGELLCFGDNNYDNTITFRKKDANIELTPLFAENEFDLSFMFRTTIQDAVIMQNIGSKSGHLFEIRLRDGLSLRYAFDVGNGLQILEVKSPTWLDNNEWHLVRVERNRKESRLIVDNMEPTVINEPMDISFQYFNFDQNLFIGTSQAYTEGFVGCLSNLKINGVIQDLYSMVTPNSTYGLSRGCIQKCVPNPCLNRGECYEFYDHYKCECGLTAYRGYICGREVGGSFNYGPMITIDVRGRDNLASVDEYMQIGFKTKSKKGILMQLKGEGDTNYIVLKVNSNGGITIEFDVGFKRFEVTTNYDIDLTNDQHHTVRAWRNDLGRKWNLQVDEYPLITKDFSEYLSETSDIRLDGPHTMYIGRNTSMESVDGFDGCMYAAQWNNIFPFRMSFADPPDPRVTFNNESIREYRCGIEEIMPENEPLEIRPSPQIPDNINFVQVEDPTLVIKRTVAGVVVSVVMVAIVILLMYFCRHFTFEKGNYKTHEAKVTKTITNPDDAIRFAKAGHPDLPNKEFWL